MPTLPERWVRPLPDDRIVLPLAELDASAVRPGAVAAPAGTVVLAVPSLVRLVQAAWVASLRSRPRVGFAEWLRGQLDADPAAEPQGGPDWRYDRAVTAWVDVVGPERVQVAVDGGTPDPSPRSLTGAEVGAVEAMLAELEDLGLTGRNASDLLQGAVDKVVHGSPDPQAPAAAGGVRPELAARIAGAAEHMLATVERSGASVAGDRSALLWPDATGDGEDGLVALSAAVDLSIGTLERVAAWGGAGSRA